MTVFRILRWLVWLFGAVVVGAVGSGVWDSILKPGLPWLANFSLNIATLGVNEFRDQLYVEIAAGVQDRAALRLLASSVGFTLALTIFGTIGSALIFRRARAVLNQQQQPQISLRRVAWLIKMPLWPLYLLLAATSGFITIDSVRTTYISDTSAYLSQLEMIAAPYANEAERLSWKSASARMSSRQDYINLVDRLVQTCNAHGIEPPPPLFNTF